MIDIACSQCNQKDDLINKYLKLIKLLKAKCQKTAQSFAKNNTQSSVAFCESSQENSNCQNHHQQSISLKSDLNPQKIAISQAKSSQLHLALKIMTNKCKKALLKQSFHKIQEYLHISVQTPQTFGLVSLKIEGSIHSIINQTLGYGRIMQQKSNFPFQGQKQLHSKIFNLQLQNQLYLKKISQLQQQINDSQKRFLKQTEKKWQSLETVAQQIREKTELVIELQQIIKKYEKTYGKSIECITMQSILAQDTDELRRSCLRLESINQKLNDDISNLQASIKAFSKQMILVKSENDCLKRENTILKQKNFQIQQEMANHTKMQTIYKTYLKRFTKKIQAVKAKEKQLYSSQKISSANMVSTKNTELSQEEVLSKRVSIRELEVEQKIEEIFTFLFHIREEDYKVQSLHLFDKDQIDLLNSHKEIYLNTVQEESFIETKRETVKRIKDEVHTNFGQTDEVFYIKNNQVNEENSFLCALEPTNPRITEQPLSNVHNMRLIEMEIEKSKLIEKISELKNLQMHIRNVVLNLLKVLDLSNLKPETEGILEVVLEIFEYSQDEKAAIFKEKKKKFWGLL